MHYYFSYQEWQNHSQNVNEALVPNLRRNHWSNATNQITLTLVIVNRHSVITGKIIGGGLGPRAPPAPRSLFIRKRVAAKPILKQSCSAGEVIAFLGRRNKASCP